MAFLGRGDRMLEYDRRQVQGMAGLATLYDKTSESYAAGLHQIGRAHV